MFRKYFALLMSLPFFSANASENNEFLHMWEDAYLMIELFPESSADEIRSELERIVHFGQANKEGLGYKNVTAIREPKLRLKDLGLELSVVVNIINNLNLPKIKKFNYQGDIVDADDNNIYGDSELGLFVENEGGKVTHIWLLIGSGKSQVTEKMSEVLNKLGESFGLVLIDYYRYSIVNLRNIASITDYFDTRN